MKRFMIAIGIIVVFLLSGCPNPATSPEETLPVDTVITLAAIPGVTAPIFGATPGTTITETAQYTGTVSWNGTPAAFAASTVYTATITLTAKAGYTFSGVAADFFTVAGATATNPVNSGVVTAVFPSTSAATITELAIPGVTAPVLDFAPVTSLDSAQYSGTISWSPADSAFAAATVYTATITLTPKAGWTLSGVAENNFTVDGASSVTHSADSGIVTAVFPSTSAATITLLAIPGVTAPVLGATPVTSITANAQYTGTVSWSPMVSGTFAGSTAYTATITLTPKAGYTLSGVAANSFTVAGATNVTHSSGSGIVTAVFPSTSAATITLLAISGVTAPVVGATPVTSITANTQYTGTVSWSPTVSGTFAGSTVYTATITLTPEAGYTLSGVSANSFTVAGASNVTHSANSGVVTASFTATAAAVINIMAIPGVTAPVTGAAPVTTITETVQYTGTVSWSPGVSNMFVSNTVYTATITLTPKAGYTLSGVVANSFIVPGATATHSANSGVVTATFSQTTANLAVVNNATSTSQPSITLNAVQGGTSINIGTYLTVSSFRMSQHEITMEQFVAVTGLTNPSTFFTGVVNGPVQCTSWYHALVFCNKLSILDGLTPVYSIGGSTDPANWGAIPTSDNITWDAVVADWSANGYRLPTEAEWLFAAQGGNSSNDYFYAGSNNVGDVAWYSGNSSNTTHTVGTKAANELGLKDMSGNVWEWCWDWSSNDPIGPQTDYRGPASGIYRILGGGSYIDDASYCINSITWIYYNPSTRMIYGGFRIVRP